MSKVLSIYNDRAFYEVVLPSVSNTEYSFLLDAETFHLPANEVVELECIRNQWYFKPVEEGKSLEYIGPQQPDNNRLPSYGRYNLTTLEGEILTILVEEKDNPLSVYRKYVLVPNQVISVGIETDNNIRYRYPADPQAKSFVSHHHCSITYDGTNAWLEDTSANGTYINNVRVNGRTKLNFGDNIRVFGLSMLYLNNLLAVNNPAGSQSDLTEVTTPELALLEAKGDENGSSARSLFYRAPRSIPKINTETVTIDPPPNPKELAQIPLFMQIGPAMTMTIPMLLGSGMTIVASRLGGASNSLMYTGIITAAASACIGVFWAVTNLRFNKKRIYQEERRRFEKYGQYLIDKQNYIEECYQANSRALCEKYISAEMIAEYDIGNEKLWSRNFNHSDVLTYRLGLGDVPSPMNIEVQKERFTMLDDSLAEKPGMIKKRFSIMQNVPVCVNFREKSLVGVIGSNNSWIQIIRSVITQIAGNNSYTDVKIALAYDANKIPNARTWEFVKWLPHVWSEDKKIRYYAASKNEAGEVFYSLGQTMRTRTEDARSLRPHYILIVLNKELLEGELITKYINDSSSDIGLSTIIVAEHYEGLPNNCEFIIENNPGFSGVYTTTDENTDKYPVRFDDIGDLKLMNFAKRLANIEVNESESGGEVPNSISFFDMYGISRPEDLNAAERWRRSKTAESMKALIGFKSGGAPCYLDIHERYHGPHGLVAGTTGSGKSETLQTYMLSLAINYSPDDVGFFIIDYKGGGMANLFEGLPHMIGAISNLSGNQVKRAMVSIKSENKRRQRIFSYYGVNNINAYTSLYKSNSAKEPIPHMFIIIDEFAELKREEPDFMRELVSVAQVGRSLGVHLILATQKPAGTVDDNIWSNSKFRLCLRVQDRQDSMDMLHRADAAYLTQAGRGYLQVGNDELFELFQSGYSGAVYDEVLGDKKLVVAQMLDSVGKIDLVGNHFKIKYQEEARHRWIRTVCQAMESACDGRPDSLKHMDDIRTEEFMETIYSFMEQKNIDYKRSQYNDARLKDFIKLYGEAGGGTDDEKADEIIDAALRQGVKLPETKSKSQLEAVNEYLGEVARTNGYNHMLQLWMPVLPVSMALTSVEGYRDFEMKDRLKNPDDGQWTLSVIVGKGDDPDNQNQMPVSVDFAGNGHHAICGTVSTGKSTFLQTVIYSLINKYTAEEVNIYILDFSSKLLTVFEEARQVGGIMTDAEEDLEKISKFFTMITTVISERKKLLASSNYRDYVEHSHKKLPAVVIAIDNYAGFKEKTDERYDDIIKQLAKEGLGYGIFLIVTAAGFGTSEIPSRLADNFRTTISLEMSDIYQYSDVMRVVRVPLYPESSVKGRGLVFYGEKIIEFQTALAAEGDSIGARNEKIKKRIAQFNQTDTTRSARKIPIIPEKPVWDEYIKDEEYQKLLATASLLPNGYDAETAAYSSIDLTSMLTYVVNGTKKSGKSTYMKTLIRASLDKGSDVCVIEIGSSEFSGIAQDTGCRYVTDGQGIYDFAKNTLLKEAGLRAPKKTECMGLHMEDDEFFAAMSCYRRICVFIPNVPAFLNELYNRESEAYNAVGVYETLSGDKGFHYNFYFFAELGDNDISDVMGYKFMAGFRDNATGIRFGGRYSEQRLFTYNNVPFKIQNNSLKAGIGVLPCEDASAKMKQVVVPNYRG